MSGILGGIIISLAGILITFAFFGLLILVIVLLREIFKIPSTGKELELEVIEGQGEPEDIARMQAAGIAVAVATLRAKRQRDDSLGRVLETPRGRWWSATRLKE